MSGFRITKPEKIKRYVKPILEWDGAIMRCLGLLHSDHRASRVDGRGYEPVPRDAWELVHDYEIVTDPEAGQILFTNIEGRYPCSDLGDACIEYVLREVGRVFWNRNQRTWPWPGWEVVDPGIPGLIIRPFVYPDEDPEGAALPNLELAGDSIGICWYKHPTRGTTLNRPVSPDEWHAWLEKALKTIRAAEPTLSVRVTGSLGPNGPFEDLGPA